MKISICTVSFNAASVIADCLRSVSSQNYTQIEHILIDGASTDSTMAILESRRAQLSALVSEPDGGIYDAMNKGIALATGEIIGFLNADDFYANDNVLSEVACCFKEDPGLDACYADLLYVNRFNSNRIVRYWKSGAFSVGSFARGWCPPHPTFFVRRSVYERFGSFDSRYRIAADAELMMRFLEVHKVRTKYVPGVWVRMRTGGTTNKNIQNILIQNTEILWALRRHRLPVNVMSFVANKVWSRFRQVVLRPDN
jgi:glycosyltransferase involved in cell wall biosynthesis